MIEKKQKNFEPKLTTFVRLGLFDLPEKKEKSLLALGTLISVSAVPHYRGKLMRLLVRQVLKGQPKPERSQWWCYMVNR